MYPSFCASHKIKYALIVLLPLIPKLLPLLAVLRVLLGILLVLLEQPSHVDLDGRRQLLELLQLGDLLPVALDEQLVALLDVVRPLPGQLFARPRTRAFGQLAARSRAAGRAALRLLSVPEQDPYRAMHQIVKHLNKSE